MSSAASAQTYQFDGDLDTPGLQNGNGTWSTNEAVGSNLRWHNGGSYDVWDNSGLAIAEFGNATSVNGGTITVDGEIKVAGMTFNTLGAPLGTTSHIFSGGTLNVGTGAIISIATGASGGSTGNQWITFSSLLKGSDLTFQKTSGTSLGFARITSANPDLTGTLTLRSATGVNSGVYLSVSTNSFISSLSRVDVQAYSTFNTTGAGPWSVPIAFAGIGGSNYGAIRVDTSNTVFNGGLILTGDGRFHTHINTLNVTVNGGISEEGGSWAFSRTASPPTNTMTPLITTYTGASTYTGATILGRVLSGGHTSTSENSGTEGGVNVLNFAAANTPATDILYNSTTAGTLQLMSGLASRTELQLVGAARQANSQSFGATSVQQAANAITLTSAVGGSMSVDLGAISRTGSGVVAITAAKAGQITGTVGDNTNGLVGTWATYRSADGATAGWAGLVDGKMGVFTGSLAYQTGTEVGTLPGWTTTTDLSLSPASSGDVTFAPGVTRLGTLSMTDTNSARALDLGGKTLRFSDIGGIQIIQGAQALTIGSAGDGSILTAGTTDNSAAQLMLTNMSGASALTVGATLTNNGSGALSLIINGTGRTVLAGTNTFTGVVSVMSGVLEVRSNGALGATGTSGITKIMGGASLNLSGDITLGETIQANGHGIALDGAIRNLSGTNTLTPQVRIQSSTRFTSDSGTLILNGGIIAQISGTAYTFSGAGDFEVLGAITATTGILNKEGSGTLTLKAPSTATGATTVSNGTLHLDFSASTAPAASILYNGVNAGALTLGGTGGGTLKATGKADTASTQAFSGVTFAVGASRITAVSSGGTGSMEINLGGITRTAVGATVRFDLPTTGSIKTSSGTDNTILTGTGGVPYATVGLTDWAATSAAVSGLRSIVGLSSLSGSAGYTPSTASSLTGHANITEGITATTLSASTTTRTLRFNEAQATTITQNASGLILTTNGILVTPNVGSHVSTITGGGIRPPVGANELIIHQNNPDAALTISSRLLNAVDATGAAVGTSLTKTGAGRLIYEYSTGYTSGDYSGTTRIQEGSLQLVKTVSNSISYPLYYATFSLGSGSGTSGKLILGSPSTGFAVTQYGGLNTQGTGTGNALVGGTTATGSFIHYVSGVSDFRNGMIGGPGQYENNLNLLTSSSGTLQLGPANTFNGKTTLYQATLEVTKLADRGVASSLGTGDVNSTSHIIDMSTGTTSSQNVNVTATLRYIGDTNSVTNRPINFSNGDIATDVISTTAVLENTGTGTVKFTAPFTAAGSNPVQRLFRLGGTNEGANEIVSITNASTTILTRIEKVGTGAWTITGGSTHGGGTAVTAGTLLVTNTTGSATGTGAVTVAAGAVLGGSGRIAPAVDQSITFTEATLQIGTELPYQPGTSASSLTLQTSGTGTLSLTAGSTLAFDLFTGAGSGNNTGIGSAADLAVILGTVSLSADTVLKVSNPNAMTAWADGDQWKLFDWSGLTTPLSPTTSILYDLPTLTDGLLWDTSALFTTGVLAIAVPEPSRGMLVLGGMLALVGRRRRRM